MGIKGLVRLIMTNIEQLCTPPTSIKGKLVVDGYSILHELYAKYKIEWASGGCYADQHRKTSEYFEAMILQGIEPIVVLEGGGTKTNVDDTIFRRQEYLNNIPGQLRKQFEIMDCREYDTHHLPLLSRKVYVSSLIAHNIKVIVADGTAHETTVQLANYYNCPILTNKNNYCVSGIKAGVILFQKFKSPECIAHIFEQPRLDSFLNFENPDLILAMVAVMGDGCETSIPFLYHGGIKVTIDKICSNKTHKNNFLTVRDFLKIENINSFQEFRTTINQIFYGRQLQDLIENCRTAEEIYGTLPDPISVEALMENSKLQCSNSSPVPIDIVKSYRSGNYPVAVINAVCEGKSTLDADIGDPEQPPVPQLGQPIREIMYGLASPLMSRTTRKCVEEYYRSCKPEDNDKPWKYASFEVHPRWKYPKLSCDNISELDDSQRIKAAKEAICQTVGAPEFFFTVFGDEKADSLVLAILTTFYWIHPYRVNTDRFCPIQQLVKALVLNFFVNCESHAHTKQYDNPLWRKVHHSLLEWQSLYQDVCGLNSMLLCPFSELPPNNILDSEFVIELALGSPDVIMTYLKKLSQERLEYYDKLIQALNISTTM